MRVNNKYIRVVATFIGEDGSREFKKGTVYILKMKIKNSYIIVSSENNESLWCPYSSMNTFLENWKLNEGEDEMSELKRPETSGTPWTPSPIDSLLDCIDKQLVVIPQLVADFIESENNNEENGAGTLVFEHYNSYQGNGSYSELHKWIANNFNDFLEAIVNGYTVEKEKKYILKHIDLSEQYKNESFYLSHSRYAKLKHESFSKDFDVSEIERCHFTQSEIDKLNIGSYEQIEVKLEE